MSSIDFNSGLFGTTCFAISLLLLLLVLWELCAGCPLAAGALAMGLGNGYQDPWPHHLWPLILGMIAKIDGQHFSAALAMCLGNGYQDPWPHHL